jgi:hypothetical protein
MPSEEEEILHLIAEELASGRPPEMVAEELVQAGLPREEAVQVVQAVAREAGGGRGGQMREPSRGGGFPWAYFFMIVAIAVLLYVLLFV